MTTTNTPIPFYGQAAQRKRLGSKVDESISRVIDSAMFVFGPEMKELEKRLAAYAGCSHVTACANGTDALLLPLWAWNVGPGDAAFVPAMTFCATVEILPWIGASAVFVDCDPRTYNMSAEHLDASIQMIMAEGKLVPKVVIPVELHGQCPDWPAIAAVARKHGLKILSDSAQSYGARWDGHTSMHWADAAATSFFPNKPLGCYGDGGAVLCNDADLAEVMESLRVHGKASKTDIAGKHFDYDPAKYVNVRVGMNSRLDTLQAAVLLHKLEIFPDEIQRRNAIAARYSEGLKGIVEQTHHQPAQSMPTWAAYNIEVSDRDALSAYLAEQGIPTSIFIRCRCTCRRRTRIIRLARAACRFPSAWPSAFSACR